MDVTLSIIFGIVMGIWAVASFYLMYTVKTYKELAWAILGPE